MHFTSIAYMVLSPKSEKAVFSQSNVHIGGANGRFHRWARFW
jgi:hypothetical protein